MINAIKSVQKEYETFEKNRRTCLELRDKLRSESKAAINFLVKGLHEKGKAILNSLPKVQKKLQDFLDKNPYLYSILSLNEGFEEYVEGVLLLHYIEGKKKYPTHKDLKINHVAYISGICDMTGELIRLARSNPKNAKKIHDDISAIYDACMKLYVTRNSKIRHKLEHLDRNIKKMEEIVYQVEL